MARTSTSPACKPTLMAMSASHAARTRLLHLQRGVGGANRIVLVRKRRAEQGHDAVALHPVDRTLVAMDGIDHRIQRRAQPQVGVFRVEILD